MIELLLGQTGRLLTSKSSEEKETINITFYYYYLPVRDILNQGHYSLDALLVKLINFIYLFQMIILHS